MTEKIYSQRLGTISDIQFQAALDRFHLGRFIQAEAIPFGDGEADLARPIAEYLKEEPELAGAFFAGYRKHTSLRPGFARRFPIYMLLDRAILWEFFQSHGWRWWPEQWTFRDWASQYLSPHIILDQL